MILLLPGSDRIQLKISIDVFRIVSFQPAIVVRLVKGYTRIQLFRGRLSEKLCTQQSRKVIWDMINALFQTL